MTRQEPRTGLCDGSPRFLFSGKAVAPSFTGFMQGGRRRERPRQRVWQLEGCGPFRAWTKGSGAPICLPSPPPLQLHPFLAHPFQPAFQPSYCAVTLSFLPFPLLFPPYSPPFSATCLMSTCGSLSSACSFLPVPAVLLFSLAPRDVPFQARRGALYSVFFDTAQTHCLITDVLTRALPSCSPQAPTRAFPLEFPAGLHDMS